MTRILVAGVGNIFNGDDAFGVEVVRRLRQRTLPREVDVIDFGIKGVDLAYALMDRYDIVILLDAAERGEAPGTLSIVEPELEAAEAAGDLMASAHDLDPATVLRLVSSLGGACGKMLLIACEPLTLGGEEGVMGLSAPVAATVEPAAERVERLVASLIRGDDLPWGQINSSKAASERSIS